MIRIPCTIMRGGTSKALFLRVEDLPKQVDRRDRMLLRIFGSPDRRQIDGLGGADPLTSKVAIVGPPTRSDADIDYTFGQVGIERPYVDYGGYCGNILSGVAAYAVDEGFVRVQGDTAHVRVHVTNTHRIVRATVPVRDGRFDPEGDLTISGVPGTGSPILLDFAKTVGSVTGRLLPSGRPLDVITIPGHGKLEISVVDVGNPMIFARLSDLGIQPGEGPDELDGRAELFDLIETIRHDVARKYGVTVADGTISENIPLVSLIGPPASYLAYGSGQGIQESEVDFIAREFFAGKVHKAYGIGETACAAAAALLDGCVVESAARNSGKLRGVVRFGHPSGMLPVEIEIDGTDGQRFRHIVIQRTARRLMDGHVYVTP